MADVTILGDIEVAIEQKLKKRGLAVREFDIADEPDAITVLACPAVNISFAGGRCRRITDTRFRVDAVYSVVVILQNVKDEKSRRRGVYPLIVGVMNSLANADMTVTDDTSERAVPIRTLIPGIIRKVLSTTTRIAYQIDFTATFTLALASDNDSGDLITLALQYYLKAGDDAIDAQDNVSLST